MSDTTAIVALVLLALGLLSALILLWRRTSGALNHREDALLESFSGDHQWAECPRETIAHIFGSEDLTFIRTRGSERLRRAFERDRRQIALHWVWSAFHETQETMARHFRAVRSSPDLSITLESKLVAEFLLHQSMCLILAGSLRLAGPNNLDRLAGAVGNLRQQVGAVIESIPRPAPGDFTKGSGLRTPS
jgi:hypothetical protein